MAPLRFLIAQLPTKKCQKESEYMMGRLTKIASKNTKKNVIHGVRTNYHNARQTKDMLSGNWHPRKRCFPVLVRLPSRWT